MKAMSANTRPSWSKDFLEWFDCASQNVEPPIQGLNVNLYDSPFWAQLVGSNRYDASDQDWACDEDYVSSIRFDFPSSLETAPWEDRLKMVSETLAEHLKAAPGTHPALAMLAVTVGFVDGDLTLVSSAKRCR
jgi:shikimate kinase